MKAMIFAAGEGRRMRELTQTVPKPLLPVAGRPLIEHQLIRLRDAGITECVINVAYLKDKIIEALGNGERWGMRLQYSQEPEPLETGGALMHARMLIEDGPFVLVNADVWTDYPFANLVQRQPEGAHLVLVPNPPEKDCGDFLLGEDGKVHGQGDGLTFSGVSVLNPTWFVRYPRARPKFPLRELLAWGIEAGLVTGECYRGTWLDVGTPERLRALSASLANTDSAEA